MNYVENIRNFAYILPDLVLISCSYSGRKWAVLPCDQTEFRAFELAHGVTISIGRVTARFPGERLFSLCSSGNGNFRIRAISNKLSAVSENNKKDAFRLSAER